MLAILHSVGMFVADLFKSRCLLEAENLFLRHQLAQGKPAVGRVPDHGELLMLGFEVAQSTVSKYIVRGFARTDACLTANPRPISLAPTGVHRNATACERARVP
jgi:hypothetical protein